MKPNALVLTTLVAVIGCSDAPSMSPDAADVAVDAAPPTEKLALLGTLSLTGLPIHDVWAYADDATSTSYALLCASDEGLRIIDTTTRDTPVQVGSIGGDLVQATDVKTWLTYAYTIGEGIAVAGSIVDLADPTRPEKVGSFPGAHNIFITESGYMILAAPGLRIFDLNSDPLNPLEIYSDSSCRGHDAAVVGTRLYDFSDNCGTRIFDISDPRTPELLGVVGDASSFHHSGWPSADGNFLFITDELASPTEDDISVWDIRDLASPSKVGAFSDPQSYVHNLYVVGRYAYVSYYRAGFRVFDVEDPSNITLLDEYDTDPTMSGPGFGGNFGVYTFSPDGAIYASDESNGLFVFSFDGR